MNLREFSEDKLRKGISSLESFVEDPEGQIAGWADDVRRISTDVRKTLAEKLNPPPVEYQKFKIELSLICDCGETVSEEDVEAWAKELISGADLGEVKVERVRATF